jgi:hypothetical protein
MIIMAMLGRLRERVGMELCKRRPWHVNIGQRLLTDEPKKPGTGWGCETRASEENILPKSRKPCCGENSTSGDIIPKSEVGESRVEVPVSIVAKSLISKSLEKIRGEEAILIEGSGSETGWEKREERDKISGPVGKTQGLIRDI